MRKIFLTSLISIGLVSCGGTGNKTQTSNAQTAAEATGQELTVDTKASSIYWKGTKLGGMHDGTIGIKEGNLTLSTNQEVEAGRFIIDMNDIKNFDLAETPEIQEKLIGHLKSADFFEVETYPTTVFTITKVEAAAETDTVTHFVSGNLKMKNIEKNIRFGANITGEKAAEGSEYVANYRAESVLFAIDRTEWNVKYGSKKLFPNLKDGIVNDNIELKIIIVANAKAIK